jgi:hypothetical protein
LGQLSAKGISTFLFYYEYCNGEWGDYFMLGCGGHIYAMQQRIKAKLLALDATSREKAVSAQEANLDRDESNWLSYVAWDLFAIVKKTKDMRYYILTRY